MFDVKVIAADKLDAYMQGVLLLPDSLARKVVLSMLAMSGGGGEGGDGGTSVVITDQGDGTGTIEVVGTASLTDPAAASGGDSA